MSSVDRLILDAEARTAVLRQYAAAHGRWEVVARQLIREGRHTEAQGALEMGRRVVAYHASERDCQPFWKGKR